MPSRDHRPRPSQDPAVGGGGAGVVLPNATEEAAAAPGRAGVPAEPGAGGRGCWRFRAPPLSVCLRGLGVGGSAGDSPPPATCVPVPADAGVT